MKVFKDEKILEVTEKAYNVVYKDKGYVPYNSKNVGKKKVENNNLDYDKITKSEIIEKLEEKEIEHDPKSLKKELFELLESD